MILLDTNVISETMKPEPNRCVQSWLNDQEPETLYLSSVTFAELLFGIAVLPMSKRKELLEQALKGLMKLFKDRILTFDIEAARCYASLAMTAKSRGRGFPTPDGYIAAIAVSKGFIVASRDTAPYTGANVPIINPWEELVVE